jgi:hypothetical protein
MDSEVMRSQQFQKYFPCWNGPIRLHRSDPATLRHRQRYITTLGGFEALGIWSYDSHRICPSWSFDG